ncbi:MAG: DoxX family membrane protein [Tenacibaculum sp.]|nr:DoxX family membrane protein [Tenacibaculum sp.]
MGQKIKKIDENIWKVMHKIGKPCLRISFAIVFIWFGLLKPFGLSPAEGLLRETVTWLPFGSPDNWLIIIGYWEACIGVLFLFKKTLRIAIALLFLQMVGTFMPLIFLPEVTFQNNNILTLTMEGQYIIKNVFIISAALVLGGDLYKSSKK